MDIQKCTAVAEINGVKRTCQVCGTCYRFTAKQSLHQAWGAPAADFNPDSGCENYYPVRSGYNIPDIKPDYKCYCAHSLQTLLKCSGYQTSSSARPCVAYFDGICQLKRLGQPITIKGE